MDQSPFSSPWQVADNGEKTPLTLQRLLNQFIDIYDVFGMVYHFSPDQVKKMDLWEIGGLLDRCRKRSETTNDESPNIQKRNLVAERIEYERKKQAWIENGKNGLEPQPPQPDDIPPSGNLMMIMQKTKSGE